MKSGDGASAQEWEAVARGESARRAGAIVWAQGSTRLGSGANQAASVIFSARATYKLQHPCKTSGWAPVYRLRNGSIRKKIIGHGMRAMVAGFALGKQVGRSRRAFSLLNKQARQHGGSVLVYPLVNQGHDLFAEIGGMRQTRQLKTLQGAPRRTEQELPRRLGRAGGHRPPLGDNANIIRRVRDVKNT
jgi:hypothetical protein